MSDLLMSASFDRLIGTPEPRELPAVDVISLEADGHLVADGRVLECGHGDGVTAVHPALLEGPERGDDEVVLPLGGVFVQVAAGGQVDHVAGEAEAGHVGRLEEP